MGSLQQVLANLLGRAKDSEIAQERSYIDTTVQTTHVETTHELCPKHVLVTVGMGR